MPQLTGVQASPGEIHGTDTYDLPTFGWVLALGHCAQRDSTGGRGQRRYFPPLCSGDGSSADAVWNDVVEYSEKDQKAHQPTWLFACRRPISSPATSPFRLLWRALAQNATRSIGPVAEVNMRGRQGPQRRRTFRQVNKRFGCSGQLPDLTWRTSPSAAQHSSAHSLRADFRAASCIVARATRGAP
jgi:hypothetical protein